MTDINKALMEIAPHITLSANTEYATVFVDGKQAFRLKITEKGGTLMGNVLTEDFIAKIKALVVDSLPEKDTHSHITRNYCLDCSKRDGFNQCLGEIRSIYG